jgi:hypothetical protein
MVLGNRLAFWLVSQMGRCTQDLTVLAWNAFFFPGYLRSTKGSALLDYHSSVGLAGQDWVEGIERYFILMAEAFEFSTSQGCAAPP